jgi:hypothetical protein
MVGLLISVFLQKIHYRLVLLLSSHLQRCHAMYVSYIEICFIVN